MVATDGVTIRMSTTYPKYSFKCWYCLFGRSFLLSFNIIRYKSILITNLCSGGYVMLYYVMLCYVMLCYVMLCYVMLCYVMVCYVLS